MYIGKHIFTKCKSAIFNAPKLLFAEIQVQINLFGGTSVDFVHPENLMMAMLGDEDKTVRAEPVNVIQRIRYGMLKKEIKTENENQSKNFIYPGVVLQQHHTLIQAWRQDIMTGGGGQK